MQTSIDTAARAAEILRNLPRRDGAVPMYVSPEPLNPEQHGALGVKRTDTPFSFAATVRNPRRSGA